jgi:hypothetical protein
MVITGIKAYARVSKVLPIDSLTKINCVRNSIIDKETAMIKIGMTLWTINTGQQLSMNAIDNLIRTSSRNFVIEFLNYNFH